MASAAIGDRAFEGPNRARIDRVTDCGGFWAQRLHDNQSVGKKPNRLPRYMASSPRRGKGIRGHCQVSAGPRAAGGGTCSVECGQARQRGRGAGAGAGASLLTTGTSVDARTAPPWPQLSCLPFVLLPVGFFHARRIPPTFRCLQRVFESSKLHHQIHDAHFGPPSHQPLNACAPVYSLPSRVPSTLSRTTHPCEPPIQQTMPVEFISPPNARELLPPLLACLSTASASKQPPPALFSLLSPILRQRVQLLASDNWLPLLCWNSEVASRLPQVVSTIDAEPHPVSGEIEVEEPERILYRRSDPETLHSRLVLSDFGLIPTYLWCAGGDKGNRWELAELRPIQDEDDGTEWFPNMNEANEAGFRRKSYGANSGASHMTDAATVQEPSSTQEEEEDDDDYWAAYDRTPAQTPHKRSPVPVSNGRVQVGPTNSELEYFARYANEVQPALDAHDPDEEGPGPGESTLNGDSLDYNRKPQTEPLETSNLGPNGYDSSMPPPFTADSANRLNGNPPNPFDNNKPEHIESLESDHFADLNHPRPSSSASSGSVEKLEREAARDSQAERAIKQHISTDMKSLFRLARTAGIQREEFERIIQRELEVLPLLEQDD
ncbi:hypothetical protein BDV95DRAFT_591684 [Massariosphaeria phaeospora]|uniref:Uncharacterized protein n=1 Tax=Massariosphaeria phaeospora TaxID=100035 RepID=A0A7C8M9Y4_9PLEO|nr:hypothetical protein BDV95DRAFT_591684 [Massariosphaeria phaeospora]